MGNKLIEVCDNCLCASCWHGEFMCDNSKTAGTILKTVKRLKELNLESSHHYGPEKLKAVYGSESPHGYREENKGE